MQEALTYDDILLTPEYSEILPSDATFETKFSKNIPLKIPIVSSPMDTVTEHRMAIAMALEGGLGIIHKNLSPENQAYEVSLVKRFENGFIVDPIVVSLTSTIDEVHQIEQDNGYKKIPVIDENGILAGIMTEFYYSWPHDQGKLVKDLMKPADQLTLAKEGISLGEANKIIRQKKLSVLCVVGDDDKLKSIVTRKDIEKNKRFPNANKTSDKRLFVGAAIGVGKDSIERAELLAKAGVDVIVVDTAHGHSKGVIEMVKLLKENSFTKKIDVVAGNVATAAGVKDLITAGADGVKIGIGPGSICTTRVVAGIGVPQITAILESVKGKSVHKEIPLIADGGIKHSGDITKALAMGAQCVMLGGLLAGAEESPGETLFIGGRMYKSYRGMGSLAAMEKGSKDRYGQTAINDAQKFVPEGIEGRTAYRGPVDKTLYQLIGGLRSGMGYLGATTIEILQKQAKPVKITSAGYIESHPHDITITEEAPNYKRS